MNERIKELVKQAGLKVVTLIDDSNRDVDCYVDSFGSVPSVASINKFAELIIRECANSIEIEYGTSDMTGNEAAAFLMKIIEG